MEENAVTLDTSSVGSLWPHGRGVVGMDGSEHSKSALQGIETHADPPAITYNAHNNIEVLP
jgi:hypothetical protein